MNCHHKEGRHGFVLHKNLASLLSGRTPCWRSYRQVNSHIFCVPSTFTSLLYSPLQFVEHFEIAGSSCNRCCYWST